MGRLYAELAAADGGKNDYVSKAIQHYQEALKLDPSASLIFEELTDLYIQTDRLRDAVAQAEDMLKQNPDNLDARRMLGRIYTRMVGDSQPGKIHEEYLRKAIEQYQKITEKDPKDAESWVMLGRLYRVSNKSPESEKAYNQALKADPDNEDALTGLAMLYPIWAIPSAPSRSSRRSPTRRPTSARWPSSPTSTSRCTITRAPPTC